MVTTQSGKVKVSTYVRVRQVEKNDVALSLTGRFSGYEISVAKKGIRGVVSHLDVPMKWRAFWKTQMNKRSGKVKASASAYMRGRRQLSRKWTPWSDPNAPSSGEAGKGDAYGQFHLPESRRLADALAEVDNEIAEEKLPPVGEATKTEAERLVRDLTRQSRRLDDALAELAEVDDEIAEEKLPPVGEATRTEAERLVRNLTRRAPASVLLAVYPTQDAGIALHFKEPDRPAAVLVLLRDDGRADCHAYIGGRSRRAHYGTSEDLPDAFVLDQLRRLAPPRVGVSTPGAGFSSSWMAFPLTNLR